MRGARPSERCQRLVRDAQGLQHVVEASRPSIASRSDTWMLTSTVRNSSLASIMRTGTCGTACPPCAAASACSSSVWPGKATPAAASASLCKGAVTSAAISPRSAARAAHTTQSRGQPRRQRR